MLYKPENFDANKKYPLIIHCYDRFSNNLFVFTNPNFGGGSLNIPWYVSNGYLVLEPDIDFIAGKTGETALVTVESAVKYLIRKRNVDPVKVGLQGHSFGGYITNFIVANSTMFAAANSSAGLANLISSYGSITFGGKSNSFVLETGQTNLRTTPWDNPGIYISNSPIFNVTHINTPLLIMHNNADVQVPVSQSIELFTALRRLNKKAWLIQYDNSGHTITEANCALDFDVRQQQFFDYYLKDSPPPKWMIDGNISLGLAPRNTQP